MELAFCCMGAMALGAGGALVHESLKHRPLYYDRYAHYDPVSVEIRTKIGAVAAKILQAKEEWMTIHRSSLSFKQAGEIDRRILEIYCELRGYETSWPTYIHPIKLGKLKPGKDFAGKKFVDSLSTARVAGAIAQILKNVPEAKVQVKKSHKWFRSVYKAEVIVGWPVYRDLLTVAWAKERRIQRNEDLC